MTRYATVTDLARRVPWSELAQAAAQDDHAVDGAALEIAAAGGDLSGYPEQVSNAILDAKSNLEKALADASVDIDSNLGGRYGADILAGASDVLNTKCLDIAVYRLLGGDMESRRYRLYKAANDWLKAVSDGSIELTPADAAGDAAGDIRVDAPERIFTDASLDDYVLDRSYL